MGLQNDLLARGELTAERRAWVAFGANLPSEAGAPLETLRAAVQALSFDGFVVQKASDVYETPCFPAGAGPDYINFAIEFAVHGDAQAVLTRLHEVEQRFGRIRKTRWAGRAIDLDLMAFDTQVWPDRGTVEHWINLPIEEQMSKAPEHLLLPHPRLQDRSFMLIPFADIAPDWVHPILGVSVQEMLSQRPEDEKNGVKRRAGAEILSD